jgi:molybdenum cofactor cytidylyltransferase
MWAALSEENLSMPQMIEENFSLGAVILAAGRSVRMGMPKLLLPWGGTSVLGHLLSQWSAAGANQIGIVHAAGDSPILGELDRLAVHRSERIENPNTDRGMFSSIVCAARWHGWHTSLTHWAIVLGDQPHLKQSTLTTLVEFASSHHDKICQPMHTGRHRHPVVLPKPVFLALSSSTATNLKEFLLGREVAGFECDDPGLDLDIDRPEDYEKAKALGWD